MSQYMLPTPSVLTVKEADGSPSVDNVQGIIVSNGTLTDNLDGTVALAILSNPMTTQDDIIVGGAAGAADRLGKGSDGQVLTVDPSTHHLVWATPAGGGAPTTTPYVTTASDAGLSAEVAIPGLAGDLCRKGVINAAGTAAATSQEWDSATTGLTWAITTPGAVDANTTIPSHLYARTTAAANHWGYIGFTPGSSDFDVIMGGFEMAFDAGPSTAIYAGMMVGDTAGANGVMILLNTNTGAFRVECYTRTSNSNAGAGSTIVVGINSGFFRINKTSTTYTCSWSIDGKLWQVAYAGTGPSMTIGGVGFWINSINSAGNGTRVAADFIRTSI